MIVLGLNQNIIRLLLGLVLVSLLVHSFFFYLSNRPDRLKEKLVGYHERALCNFKQNGIMAEVKEPPPMKCPDTGIVTAFFAGALNAQMCSYASVLAMAQTTKLQPFVPICMHTYLSELFSGLTVPTLSAIKDCNIPLPDAVQDIAEWEGIKYSIVLRPFDCAFSEVPFVTNLTQEFTIRDRYVTEGNRKLLSFKASNSDSVYVGIYLPSDWKESGDGFTYPDETFYDKVMTNIRKQEGDKAVFVVISENPVKTTTFEGKDVFFMPARSIPFGLDLVVLSLCNISVVGFEGIGVWGALLSKKKVIAYGSYDDKFKPLKTRAF
ncbi:UNVERIFIED_CONTAM: hypothetical protein PYX00_008527 [Menopon gallinae]|uniref:L-Fucosyltransferase n=1 Tax=Menopon gallinae TaxID=328185 RepID=A0AAW2HNM5_9NEOP